MLAYKSLSCLLRPHKSPTMHVSAIIVVAFLYATLVYWLRARKRLPSPPGPKGHFFVGNTFQVPATFEWETYQRWSKEHGSDIIKLDIAGAPVVVLNSVQAAVELLEKRSSSYSSRTRGPMLMELCGFAFNFAQIPYGSFWRAHRRLFHQTFHQTLGASWYKPQQVEAARALVEGLSLNAPRNIIERVRFVATSLAFSVGYGLKVDSPSDPLINIAHAGAHGLASMGTPGKYLVDSLPILAYVPTWMPGAGFRVKAKAVSKDARAFTDVPFQTAKDVFSSGTYRASLVTSALSKLNPSQDIDYQETIIKNTAATTLLGGVDTTASSLVSFVMAMLAQPEVQRRAQMEIDDVVFPGSLVDFEHEPALPYITAIVKEVIRWKPVTPVGIPHYIEVDDVYEGFHIPRGTLVIANQWAMLHDERNYPNPEVFDPDRFMKDDVIDQSVMDPMTVAFGFGRRICPGRHMAYSSLWIFVASMLQALTIEKAIDQEGNVIEPSYKIRPGLICFPQDFQCKILPREDRS